MIVNEEEEASGESAEPDIRDNKMSKKSAMVIIKAVTEKIPDRELVKLLKGRFRVTQKSLTTLSVTQLLEVTARKLIKFKYVSLKLGVGLADIKRADITVNPKIAL